MQGKRKRSIWKGLVTVRKYFFWFYSICFAMTAALPAGFPETFTYDSHGKRDPFVKTGTVKDQTGDLGIDNLNLQGIIADPEGAYVIMNDEIVKEGEVFSGFKLAKVFSDKIALEKGGQTFALLLRRDDNEPPKKTENENSKKEGPKNLTHPRPVSAPKNRG